MQNFFNIRANLNFVTPAFSENNTFDISKSYVTMTSVLLPKLFPNPICFRSWDDVLKRHMNVSPSVDHKENIKLKFSWYTS